MERINQFHSSLSFSRGSCVRVRKAISGADGECKSESGRVVGNNEFIFKSIIIWFDPGLGCSALKVWILSVHVGTFVSRAGEEQPYTRVSAGYKKT